MLRALILCIVLLAAVLGYGSIRQPTGPAEGHSFSGQVVPSLGSRSSLRVATFNIHGGKGLDARINLPRTAECIKGLDLVGLNEVHAGRLPWHWNQSEELGHMLGLAWLFAPTERRWWQEHFGNGVVTDLSVTYWQRIPLSGATRRTYRNAVVVGVRYRTQPVNVLVTHLDRGADRDGEFQNVMHLFLALPVPSILMGDLNSTVEELKLKRLLETRQVADAVGEVLKDSPHNRIDWILTRGFRTLDAGFCNNGASDHPSVWAELVLSTNDQY